MCEQLLKLKKIASRVPKRHAVASELLHVFTKVWKREKTER